MDVMTCICALIFMCSVLLQYMFGCLRDIVPRMLYTRHMVKADDLVQFYDEEISAQFKQVQHIMETCFYCQAAVV